jgi:polygalacturonase
MSKGIIVGVVGVVGASIGACGGNSGSQEDIASQQAAATGVPQLATGDSRSVSQPSYPAVCTTLTANFGTSQRSSPPSSDDTSRVAAALSACKGTGKGVVLAASGSHNAFFTGTIDVNGEALVVDSGVTLFGSSGYSGELILVSGTNAAIMGPGTIDGRGDLISGTPRLVQANGTTNFVAYNVTMQHPGKEHLYVEGGNGFTAWGIHIATPANTHNTDGIDIDSMTNATVESSFIEDGDDGIAVKTNHSGCSNVTVRNNVFRGTHGMSIGSQTFDGVTNVLWENNTMYGTDEWGHTSTSNNGIRIKSDASCGGPVKQVTFNATCLSDIEHPILFSTHYGSCSGTSGTPQYTDIVVNGVFSTKSPSNTTSEFNGFSASAPLSIALENVDLDVKATASNQYANVQVFNSNVSPSGTGVVVTSFTGSGSIPSCSFGGGSSSSSSSGSSSSSSSSSSSGSSSSSSSGSSGSSGGSSSGSASSSSGSSTSSSSGGTTSSSSGSASTSSSSGSTSGSSGGSSGGAIHATLSVQSSWGGGYCDNLTVYNSGSGAVSTWKVVLNTNQSTITSDWNATFAGTGPTYTITPESWNASIPAGGSQTVGFCANVTGTNSSPTVVSVTAM